MKKFVASKFLDYKMVDNKSIITQVQELQVIMYDLLVEGLVINKAFQVATTIGKLPPLWKDFKNYLKHKRKEMSLEDHIVQLRIEEDDSFPSNFLQRQQLTHARISLIRAYRLRILGEARTCLRGDFYQLLWSFL